MLAATTATTVLVEATSTVLRYHSTNLILVNRNQNCSSVQKNEVTPPWRPDAAERAARLYRLLQVLGRGPQSREALTRRFSLNVRGFYRDVETLQRLGIPITLGPRGYTLGIDLKEALGRLPFPDPGLTFAEAEQLAKGRTAAHRKLKELIGRIVK